MANSHEGKLIHAKKIVEGASKAGADAIKFQKFTANELAERDHENYGLYKRLEMNIREWDELIKFTKNKKLKVFVDVFGVQSAKNISKLGIDGYKIHSADISNPNLIQFLARTKKPILLSTAGCLLNEVDEAIKSLAKIPKEIALMHGFQGYPTKLDDINLLRISELKKKYDLPVGLMDHVSGNSPMAINLPLIGIGMGATIIEKHITLDRSKKGLDYYSALNPEEFRTLVSLIRMTEKSLGKSEFILSGNEMLYRQNHKKNPIARRFIKKGIKLNEKMFDFKRTKTKRSVSFYKFKGKLSSKNIPKGITLTENMLTKKQPKVAAVIACRVDSSRLYAKPLQQVGKYQILELLLNQIKKSTLINEIVLAISENPGNEAFVNFAKEHKLKFIRGNDKDVLKRLIDGAKYVNADVVFRITSENPFIYWEKIDLLIKKHVENNFDISYIHNVPLGVGYEIINLKALEISHKFGSRRHRSELCSLYIKEHKDSFKIHRLEIEKALQRPEMRLTVDSPQDLWVARLIQKSIGKGGDPIPLRRIISFLDKNPNISRINSDIPVGVSRIWY